jgi:uncharacterized phage protein gp47/JayE
MSFFIPDLKTLSQRTRNAFVAAGSGLDAWVWPNNVYVAAKVFAGIVHLMFARLKWIDKQRFVHTADDEEQIGLHGAEYGIGRKAASFAQGYVEVPLLHPDAVSAGTIFTRSDGIQYRATQTVAPIEHAISGVVRVPVICTTVGKIGNALAATPLTSTLVNSAGELVAPYVADEGIGQGADIEPLEQWKARILDHKRRPPMGGAEYDYEKWALEMPGVTRVFVKGNAFGPGTVGVWPLMDGTYPFGIPQEYDIEAIQEYIDARKPVTAYVFVQAPIPDCIDVVVNGVVPDTPQTRSAVAAELLAVFLRMTHPGLPGKPFVLRHSWLEQAVSNATGEQFNDGVSAPATNLEFPAGVVPCLRSVTFK